MASKIHLRSTEPRYLEVQDDADEIVSALGERSGQPVRLTTTEGATVLVNWSNVLYVEAIRDGTDPALEAWRARSASSP